MDNFKLEATEHTPYLDFNPQSGILNFEGKSYPENSFKFYTPVNQWLKTYFKETKNQKTQINFNLIYLNSSSLKTFFDIFDIFEEAVLKGKELEINWYYYEDDDITQEVGEDFKEDFQTLQINLITKKD